MEGFFSTRRNDVEMMLKHRRNSVLLRYSTSFGVIHFLRRRPRGEGPYLVKLSTKGGWGVKNVQNLVYIENG